MCIPCQLFVAGPGLEQDIKASIAWSRERDLLSNLAKIQSLVSGVDREGNKVENVVEESRSKVPGKTYEQLETRQAGLTRAELGQTWTFRA